MKEFWSACKETCVACVGLSPVVWFFAFLAIFINPDLWWEYILTAVIWPVFWFIFGVGFSFAEGE